MNIKPMLANSYKNQNTIGWWISEKLDGVRAIWTGENLITRNGNVLAAPAWFTSGLPPVPLDGELWLGRGNFQTLAGLVRRKSDDWQGVTYQVFDTPTAGLWEERLDKITQMDLPAHAMVVEQQQCQNPADIEHYFDQVLQQGGEGLILKAPQSPYIQGRTSQLLKVKPSESEEATVTGYTEGEGQFLGLVGALRVRKNGVDYKVGAGLPHWLRHAPPAIGSEITVGFIGRTTAGIPRHPFYIETRDYE